MLAEKEGISYEILQENNLKQTVACISEVFPGGEPMTKALGITPDEFYPFAEIYCKKAINDGLSIIAKDKASRKVIGFMISEDFVSEPAEEIKTINAKFHPILALLDSLDEIYKKSHKVEKGQIFRLFMGGVNEHYKRRNVGMTLTEESLKLAKTKNFSGAIGEATGFVSQHILRDKFGFDEKAAIEYKSFTYKGENVFKTVEDAPRCVLVEKRF